MYYLELTETFSAAHALRDYPGVCARIHGHNWKVRVVVTANAVDDHGITVDYAVLRRHLLELIGTFDHNYFNDLPYFRTINPTSENISRYVFETMSERLPQGVALDAVQIWETDNFSVTFRK